MRKLLASVAVVALTASQAWAVSGFPPSSVKQDQNWPNGRFFSTVDAPSTYYCVSSQDPAGTLIYSMLADALTLVSYDEPVLLWHHLGDRGRVPPSDVSFRVGTPSGSWAHPADCPGGSYVFAISLDRIASPQNQYQDISIKMSGQNQPACMQYAQAYAPTTLNGASVNDPNAQNDLSALVTSQFFSGTISAIEGGANPQDCPSVNYVNDITVH
jgi:hypothetical protein